VRISVIIPCFNSGHRVEATLESVLRQTVRPYEILFLDDGSTDDTWQRLEGFQSRHPDLIRLFRWPENIGSGMRSELIDHARGDWIANLDHDDLWMPKKLEKQIAAHQRHPRAEVIHTDGWNQPGDLIRARALQPRPKYIGPSNPHAALFLANFILASSAMYSMELFNRARTPNTYVFPLIGDYEFWLRVSSLDALFVRVPEPLTIRRAYPTGQLGSRLLEHFRDAVQMYEQYEAKNREHPRFTPEQGQARLRKAKLDLIVNLLMSPSTDHHEEAAQCWMEFLRGWTGVSSDRYRHQITRLIALARMPNPRALPTADFPEHRWRRFNLDRDRKKALLGEWKHARENEEAFAALAEETARVFRLGGVSPPFLSIYENEANRIQALTDEVWSALEDQDRRWRPFWRR
jgi:glycosyltransferase involved in cell wall biosynthesis